jgi:hypothetical protein
MKLAWRCGVVVAAAVAASGILGGVTTAPPESMPTSRPGSGVDPAAPAGDCDCDPTDPEAHFVVYINDRHRPETHYFAIGAPSIVTIEIHNWPEEAPACFKLSQRSVKGQSAVTFLNYDLTPADTSTVYYVRAGRPVSVKTMGKTLGDEVEIIASSAE